MLIGIEEVSLCNLRELQLGEIFLPVEEHGSRFVAGYLRTKPVLVCLEGEEPFAVGETADWVRSPGLSCKRVRYLVDLRSAVPAEITDALNGALLLTSGGPAILSIDRVYRYVVGLTGENSGAILNVRNGDVAFRNWKIVAGSQEDPILLFEKTS